MSETEQLLPEQNHAVDGPGRRLAEARKARGLSLEEVAAQLRLNVSTLQALESDDASRLPPAAYVSGYLRSYARALGLSEAEVLRGNAATASGEPPLVGVVARSRTAQVNANDPQVRFVSYLVIGGLLLISSAWWLAQQEESAPAEPPVMQAAPEGAVAPVDPAAVALQPAPADVVNPVTAAGAPAASVAAAPVAPAVAAAAPARPAASAAPAAAAPATPPAPAVETPPKPELPPPPPLTADTPQSKVTLEFSAECWVDVTDAAGRQLAYELAPAGRKLTVRGEAPFKVFFGYSPGVQVWFNDQLFDHRPLQRRDMARFKLGTAEDNTLRTEQ